MRNQEQKINQNQIVNVEIYFSGNKVLKIKNKSFDQIIELLVTEEVYLDNPPLKIKFPSTGKTLYWHTYSFNQYLTSMHGPTMSELVERFQCDDIMRNKTDIEIGGEVIDEHSLWMLRNKTCILVDTDQHLECNYQEELFYTA